MITPMKKVTVLCVESARGETVEALRALGVLHVVHGAASAGAASSATAETIERVEKARRILAEAADPQSAKRADGNRRPSTARPEETLERVLALDAERETCAKRLTELRAEEEAQEAFGEFDPAQLRALAERGAKVSLFRIPRKAATGPAWESFVHGGAAVLAKGAGHVAGYALGALPEIAGLEAVPPPSRRLSEVRGDIAATESKAAEVREALAAAAPEAASLAEYAESLEGTREFQRVGESLAAHGAVSSLDGYVPATKVAALESAARDHGWALWVRDPAPDEKPPVQLTLPRWLRPVTVLFEGLGILPGYREVDASSVFLAFFSLFFAMILGDAGYGALMLLTVLLLRRKFPKANAKPFWLFGLFAVATIVWGGLTGAWFGIASEHLPRLLRGIPWLKEQSNIMWLCFLIGAIHLTIANLWNAAVLWPDTKAFAQVGWAMMNWTMFFVAGNLVTGSTLPGIAIWMGVVGIVLIVVFMLHRDEIKKEFINYPMLALNLMSALVDVMSYIRLFAVGMASAMIAQNFNDMALGLSLPGWAKPIPVLLVLLLGHGINLVLGALSILVHAVRLNTLEFSNHVGLTWSGEAYRPFAERR